MNTSTGRAVPRRTPAGRTLAGGLVAGLTLAVTVTATPAFSDDDPDETLRTVTALDGPRGVAAVPGRGVYVTESDGSFSLVVERRRHTRVIELASVPGGFPPAIDVGRGGRVYVLTGAGGEPGGDPAPGSSTLYEWRRGWSAPKPVADIAAYQQDDPDPYDLEANPGESNPYGLEALHDGTVLVADAAGNDLLRVWPRSGAITTVARLMPRTVAAPDGLPPGMPPAGTEMPSEAVATSVSVGPDGAWYVGELRGFPATPGTSQIWRIKPGSVDATCDPELPDEGACRRYADGLTSIVDLAGHRGEDELYALSLSNLSWLAMELGVPGAEIGGLFEIDDDGEDFTELVPGDLVIPGGVDLSRKGDLYVTGPMFGPGALMEVED